MCRVLSVCDYTAAARVRRVARAGCGLVLVSSPATVTTRGDTRHRRTAAPQLPVRCTLVTPPHHAAASSNHSASSRCRYSVSGAQSGGGHRCLLCPLYSAEPLYCTVQLPGLVAVVQVASPPARQPRYCIIIMVGAAPAPAAAAGNPGVVLWCCPAATATATATATTTTAA